MNKNCEECGTEFVDHSTGKFARFCSGKCRYRWHNKTEARKQAARVRSNSDAARARHRQYIEENRPIVLDGQRERMRKHRQTEAGRKANTEANIRRAERKAKGYVAKVFKKKIYKRDNFTCQVCGTAVEVDRRYPDPLAPSLDHIVPFSKGGTHEPSNVQLTHWFCNASKRDKIIYHGPPPPLLNEYVSTYARQTSECETHPTAEGAGEGRE